MGTRGFVGFVADNTEKITYNHSDSYPSGLGLDVLAWLRFAVSDLDSPTGGVPSLRESVNALRMEIVEHRPGQTPYLHGSERGIPACELRERARAVADRLGIDYIDPIDPTVMSLLAEAEAV